MPRGSGRGVRLPGLSKGGQQGEKETASPLPPPRRPPAAPFSPTASIKLCQLLPLAKPCLRETDLKGPKSADSTVGLQRHLPVWPEAELHPLEVRNESGDRRRALTLSKRVRKMLKTGNKKWIKDLNVWRLHINEISKCDRRLANFISSTNLKIILIQLRI